MQSSAVGMPPCAPAAQHRADEVAPLQVTCAATAVDMCVEKVLPCLLIFASRGRAWTRWWVRSTANHTCTPCASWSLCACGAHGAVGVGSCRSSAPWTEAPATLAAPKRCALCATGCSLRLRACHAPWCAHVFTSRIAEHLGRRVRRTTHDSSLLMVSICNPTSLLLTFQCLG